MKSLVIAEKPSVAADLARVLGKVPKKGEHYENDEWVISSAVGHVVELEMPEDIDKKKYGFWRLEMLPIIPEKFGLKPIAASKDRFTQLKKLLARKDVDQVINACDAGREGELIFTYLYQLTKAKLPVKRAWMQTMTPGGILTAFKNLRDGAQMAGLADAARCRSESDWLIGINGTRALTKRMFGSRAGNVASVGRVQTPTLAIVATSRPVRTGASRPPSRSPRAATRASISEPILKKRKTTITTASTAFGKKPSPRRSSPPARATRQPAFRRKKRPAARPRHVSMTSPRSSARPTTATVFLPAAPCKSPRRCTSGTR
jgi:hypothetical protein